MQVIQRMRLAFPEMTENSRDHLWQTCDRLRGLEQAGNALRVAVRDLQERGPVILFHIPLSGGSLIRGVAERYRVSVSAAESFPEEFRLRFTSFLQSLKLQPILIRDGNDF
jgi:hypothetical protein